MKDSINYLELFFPFSPCTNPATNVQLFGASVHHLSASRIGVCFPWKVQSDRVLFRDLEGFRAQKGRSEPRKGQMGDRRGRLKRQSSRVSGQGSQNLFSKVQFLRGFWWLFCGLVIIWEINYRIILFSAPKSCFYSLLYSTLIPTLCYPPGSFRSHDRKRPKRSRKGLTQRN